MPLDHGTGNRPGHVAGLAARARASMFGLAHHSHSYEGIAGRLAAPLYRRAAGDVVGAQLPSNARILDVGTGPGLLPRQIAVARPDLRIEAVDLAVEMIEEARRASAAAGLGGRITFTTADAAALPFSDGAFDLVVSTISQHHWSDPAAVMAEIGRVLRPGCQAWIYDFRWSLNRAQRAAVAVRPALAITRQSPLSGTRRFTPIGRLVLAAGPSTA